MRRSGRRLLAVVLLLLALAGCDDTPTPAPTPTQSPAPTRPFTVMTTDRIRVTDPAAISDPGSDVIALNVFQRLMTADPGADVLKPDAARDCIFEAVRTYVCTLNEDLIFSNGHPLTSSDVKFSIERAARLNVGGSSASLLSSLRKIETPDPLTVRFLLSREDTQFGWALASPAASIVDEELYNPDEVRASDQPIVGSGPFTVSKFSDKELQLVRFADYKGRNPARMAGLSLRTMPDSGSIEEAMKAQQVDVVWRGLGGAAVTRLTQQIGADPEQRTVNGYAQVRLPGARVHQLLWNPGSATGKRAEVRRAIRDALQGDRTSDSVVPNGVPGHVTSFALGGKPKITIDWSSRIPMTLGYDAAIPDGRDLANQVRTRLEDTGGLSVRLRPDDPNADLAMLDRKAWTTTAVAWLQPYLDNPSEATGTTVRTAETQYRASVDNAQAAGLLAQLQTLANTDGMLVPMDQGDEVLFSGTGVEIDPESFGPGWQLGLWGMKG